VLVRNDNVQPVSELTEDDHEAAATLTIKKQRDGYIAHAQQIIEMLNNDLNAIELFIK